MAKNKKSEGMMREASKLALVLLSCCCLAVPLLGAEPETDPGERWAKKAQQKELEPFQIEAYRQLSRIHRCSFQQWTNRGHIRILSPSEEPKEPMDILHAMGMRVLPILSEAISDDTPSGTVTVNRSTSRRRVWKVNELVARLIRLVADRQFAIGDWGEGVALSDIGEHPELQTQFKELVLTWYEQNKDKTNEERKIADLQSNLRNRLDAMMWLGTQKSTHAIPFITARIEKILSDETVSSSTHTELAEAGLSLGRIGAPSTLPSVTKACKHLSYWSHNPVSNQRVNLFKAYHGMALLGGKRQALTELNKLYVRRQWIQ